MAKIAVDAMGGDHAPGVVVEGALQAATEFGVEIILVGDQSAVEAELRRFRSIPPSVTVSPAAQKIGMDESPSAALRKKESSMKVAFELMKTGRAEAVVSAGNSGAFMAVGMFVAGTLPQVERPAILVTIPNLGRETVIIDAGANVDCKPRQLVQFGLMGSLYAARVLGVERPRVGVLSNGEEESKGNELTRSTSEQMQGSPLNYVGYVEGRDIFSNKVDVVVCDGFTGNVALKAMEGTAGFVAAVLREVFRANLCTRLGYMLCRKTLKAAYARLDHAEYGGAPLLGLNGVAIIAHGGSDARAIKNAIRVANQTVFQGVNTEIVATFDRLGGEEGGGENKLARRIWRNLRSKIENFGEKPPDGEEENDGESK
jgi:glycerol-3-phosphate acyltransferase PlsX